MTPEEKQKAYAQAQSRNLAFARQLTGLCKDSLKKKIDVRLSVFTLVGQAFAAALNATDGNADEARNILVNDLNKQMNDLEKQFQSHNKPKE